ncbi:hypothetical protein D9619_010811 [Psilocybe cf. subviscida]|uniref:RNase H type-1 domain-containing protein n=1 Tax=Psilocybe cf. subviscida TaxID=2480587 RepID=A0A8H5B827_9AGAR|nr:hypothetical protein D9619_010811 [Psilocybe cf. subviscida]
MENDWITTISHSLDLYLNYLQDGTKSVQFYEATSPHHPPSIPITPPPFLAPYVTPTTPTQSPHHPHLPPAIPHYPRRGATQIGRTATAAVDYFNIEINCHGCIKPVGSKTLACAQQHLYPNAFLQELEGDANTIHAAADGSLPTSERLQATAAVIIRWQTERIHQNRFVAGRVTAHNAELYAIRSAVVQCTQHNAKQIVIFTDAIGSARVAVDLSPHSGQAHLLAVCAALQGWLQGDEERTITFVNVPSALRWSLHGQAHQYATQLRVPLGQDPVLTINSIRQTTDLWHKQEWKTKFLHSLLPGAAFLRLWGVDGTQLQPSSKGRPWIKSAGSDNVLFACMCRCVLNHAPIGSYYTHFNIDSRTHCSCGQWQDREHILAYYHQYTRISIDAPALGTGLVRFLKDNPSAFAFPKPDQGVG